MPDHYINNHSNVAKSNCNWRSLPINRKQLSYNTKGSGCNDWSLSIPCWDVTASLRGWRGLPSLNLSSISQNLRGHFKHKLNFYLIWAKLLVIRDWEEGNIRGAQPLYEHYHQLPEHGRTRLSPNSSDEKSRWSWKHWKNRLSLEGSLSS